MTTFPLLFKTLQEPEHGFDRELRLREQENFVRFLRISQYPEYAAAIIYAASIATISDWGSPLSWLAVFSVLMVVRMFAISSAARELKNIHSVIVANMACGICWGASAFYFTAGNNSEAIVVATMWLSGLLVSALGLAAVSSKSPVLWGSPILICLLIKLFGTQNQLFVFMALGVILLTLFFTAIVYLTRATIRRDFVREMQNASLAERLATANHYAEQLNTDLRLEIKQRERVESELIVERDHAKRLSTIDSLTGISNRRAFDTAFEEEVSRARRNKHTLSLIFIDVDRFKEFNDARGHQAGDDVLRQVAEVIESSTRRETDLSSRYGGEEFAVLLPNTELSHAGRIAEAVRLQLLGERIAHPNSDVHDFITVSLGVSSLVPESEDAAMALLRAADQALYSAKSAGRNRTSSASI